MERAAQSVGHFGAAARASGGISCERTINYHVSGSDESMKFPISRRLLAKHKFDYVANFICQAAARHAPCHSSMSQGRLTQCIWEPTRCAHTHTQTHTETEQTAYVSGLQKFVATTATTKWTHLKRERTSRNFVRSSCFSHPENNFHCLHI